MTNKERVLASIDHKRPDKIPYNVGFTVEAHRKVVEFYSDPDFASNLDNCLWALSTHRPGGDRMVTPDRRAGCGHETTGVENGIQRL